MQKSEKYKKAEKDAEELLPVFTVALIIWFLMGFYSSVLKDNSILAGIMFYMGIMVFVVFCFLYEHKRKKHNLKANSNVA